MKLFDLHCDTPLELYRNNLQLESNDLHVSLSKASVFDKYVQCTAIFSRKELSDEECFSEFLKISEDFQSRANGLMIKTAEQLENCKKAAFILTVEDARLVSKDLDRISLLYEKGVRVITLLWSGKTSVGCGWDTDGPLTDRGCEILERLFDTGIVPDISHANDTATEYALKRSSARKKPVIATHSNSRSVCSHKRNLTDENARRISLLGGIVGVSLYPPHLSSKDVAEISHITDHISHYINICGSEAVCLGCDFDGIDKTPEGISHIGSLPRLYDALSHRFSEDLCDSVFYNNAYKFFTNNLPRGKTK